LRRLLLAFYALAAAGFAATIERSNDGWLVTVQVPSTLSAKTRAQMMACEQVLSAVLYPDCPRDEPKGIRITVMADADRRLGVATNIVRGATIVRDIAAGTARDITVRIPATGLAGVVPCSYLQLRRELYDRLRTAEKTTAFDAWIGYELACIYDDTQMPVSTWLAKGRWPALWPPTAQLPADALYAHCRAAYLWGCRPQTQGISDACGSYAQVLCVNAHFMPALAAVDTLLVHYQLSNGLVFVRNAQCHGSKDCWPDVARLMAAMLTPEELQGVAPMLQADARHDVPRAWEAFYAQMVTAHPAATVCVASYGTTNGTIVRDATAARRHFQQGRAAYQRSDFNLTEALEWFLAAMDADPTVAEAYMYAGACLSFGNRPAEALPFLWAARRLNHLSGEAETHTALAYAKLGCRQLATASIRHAYALDPSNAWIRAKYAAFIPTGEPHAR
jgi:tetratricopeptide (TPR) repeat protein